MERDLYTRARTCSEGLDAFIFFFKQHGNGHIRIIVEYPLEAFHVFGRLLRLQSFEKKTPNEVHISFILQFNISIF